MKDYKLKINIYERQSNKKKLHLTKDNIIITIQYLFYAYIQGYSKRENEGLFNLKKKSKPTSVYPVLFPIL